jgi:methylated-DNA-[protein]-cysteine S-methyltransferase
MENLFTLYCESPLGIIEIKGNEEAIYAVSFVEKQMPSSSHIPDVLFQCKTELQEYFDGGRKDFDVPLAPEGTSFQKEVWAQLMKIGYGHTTSYMAIAKKMNNPGAVRAVGLANGKNPVGIIIPCHRVIGEDGSLTGYAGGLWRKKWMLEHEGRASGKSPTLF